jgi:hypothetical protein
MKARVVAASALAIAAIPHDAEAHVRGCHTSACDQRVHVKRRLHWAHTHPFEFARHHLPRWGSLMLARLRGCETRGLSATAAYTYRGAHDGAYQYLYGTWLRTIPALPTGRLRKAATRGPAYSASAAEQDVRTFYFYPAHRGEWACRA